MQNHYSYKRQTGSLNIGNRVEATKIISMEYENSSLYRTFVAPASEMMVVKSLLSESWAKKSAFVFTRDRNNYTIEIDGNDHPLWSVKVTPKNEEFNEYDWKLKQDFKKLRNLGKPLDKRLYLNQDNKAEVKSLLDALMANGFQLIYNDNYIIFRNQNQINIFKIAARMNLVPQPDGWYVGQKKIL